ncbi:MAG TPA: diaminopimelate decarboxylase [Thermoanaerobaculia bacterium]|jgi:diaminopimelate decarboxylase|nr:diaminopimelate decarboxylase [Thermoanaerobaculia bacterium]
MANGFSRDNRGQLCCDGVSLEELAAAYGTPLYVYSGATFEENFRRFDAAFASVPHLVCYATKANSALALLRLVAELGGGADVVSGGELRAALESGIPAERVVFSGVGKTEAEISAGVEAGILAINAESAREIEKIDACAQRLGTVARVALRVNPDIDARSHPYISTGLRQNKFGVDISRAREIFAAARGLPGVRMTGVQAHIGSQIGEAGPLAQTAGELAALARELAADGFAIETVDVGGGLGIGERRLSPEDYAAAVLPRLDGLTASARILVEPGRAIVGPAGTLIARVLYVKEERGRAFVVVDAGMNDLLRPALYQASHPIESVGPEDSPRITADVVGPVCETADCFQRDARLPRPEEGDLIAIRDAGAYGAAMSSNYNFRSRPAEVLVESAGPRVIRRRETFEDLTRLERT